MGVQHIIISNDGTTFISCADQFGRTRLFYIIGECVRGYFRGCWKELNGEPADTIRGLAAESINHCPTYRVKQFDNILR
jgi:hypothetical protein